MPTTILKSSEHALPQNREACVCSALRGLARRTTAIYDHSLAPTGLKQTQYAVLARLDRLVHCSLAELAKASDLDVTSLSRALRPLVNARLVNAGQGKDDRTKRYELTARGKRVLRKAYQLWLKAQTRVHGVITADHVRTIQNLSEMLLPLKPR